MGEKKRPKIYVVNRSTHDYSAAEKYGELVYVTEGYQKHFATGQHTRLWLKALANSSPDDFIITSSINTLCTIGGGLFAAMHGRLNLLLWRNGSYIKREIHFGEALTAAKVTPMWAVPLLEEYVKKAKEERND